MEEPFVEAFPRSCTSHESIAARDNLETMLPVLIMRC
jgi:hypothetical protein